MTERNPQFSRAFEAAYGEKEVFEAPCGIVRGDKTFNNPPQIVICGFPGVGKSWLARQGTYQGMEIHDSDSSLFSWTAPGSKERHPQWPQNYIDHIKSVSGIVLCSTHDYVLQALKDAKIPFFLVFPYLADRNQYMARYRERGSPEYFIDLLRNNWDAWITNLWAHDVPRYELGVGASLEDAMPLIMENSYGADCRKHYVMKKAR